MLSHHPWFLRLNYFYCHYWIYCLARVCKSRWIGSCPLLHHTWWAIECESFHSYQLVKLSHEILPILFCINLSICSVKQTSVINGNVTRSTSITNSCIFDEGVEWVTVNGIVPIPQYAGSKAACELGILSLALNVPFFCCNGLLFSVILQKTKLSLCLSSIFSAFSIFSHFSDSFASFLYSYCLRPDLPHL